jgi:transglutaminase superfamily protein
MIAANHSIQEKARRFWRLTPEDRGLVLQSAVLLTLTRIGLRAMDFHRCKEMIDEFSSSGSRSPRIETSTQLERGKKIVAAMSAVERNSSWCPNCLERSLALWWFLRLNQIDGELHIGGRKTESRFEAHAWVEWNGHVVNDNSDVHQHYARFDAPLAAAEAKFH